jgi:hypothetical protein
MSGCKLTRCVVWNLVPEANINISGSCVRSFINADISNKGRAGSARADQDCQSRHSEVCAHKA